MLTHAKSRGSEIMGRYLNLQMIAAYYNIVYDSHDLMEQLIVDDVKESYGQCISVDSAFGRRNCERSFYGDLSIKRKSKRMS